MSGVINTHLFVITRIDTFIGNRSCYKTDTSCHIKDVPTMFQLFLDRKLDRKLSKGGNEFVQDCDSGRMQEFCARIIRLLFSLYFQG